MAGGGPTTIYERGDFMMNAKRLCGVLLPALLVALCAAAGCHTAYQCPILQPMTLGTIPAPLPPAANDASDTGSTAPQRAYIGSIPSHPAPEGDAYKVLGYRNGIRFYVVQYSDKLYRGGDILSQEGAQALKALGIKTVISITPSLRERALAKDNGFVLVEMPFAALTRADLDKFIAAVASNPAPIYVHDFGGINKAGILLAYYRIRKEGWTYERAINEFWRLDANYWDVIGMVNVLKANAGK
jgi:hypothetical protein